MENLKKYKSIKEFMASRQKIALGKIVKLILKENSISAEQLIEDSKKPNLTDARRKIAILARLKFNIEGSIIADRLNLDKSQVFSIIYSSFDIMSVEKDYQVEIELLMKKIKYEI